MSTFLKWLPWIIAASAAAAFIVYMDKYNKAKAANKGLADAVVQTNGNTGIGGGLDIEAAADSLANS